MGGGARQRFVTAPDAMDRVASTLRIVYAICSGWEPVEFIERSEIMRSLKSFFSPDDEELILNAIRQAESRTSGEIMVSVERKAGNDPMAVARKAFDALGMRNTELHNGVLFLVAIARTVSLLFWAMTASMRRYPRVSGAVSVMWS